MTAQTPDLEIKKDLSSSLISSARNFTEANGVDTIMLPMNAAGDFTLEVTGKVSSAVGRGLDIEARKNDGTGFRTSVSSSKLYWSAPLANMSSKTFSTTAEQTLRYAVKGKEVHVYQNGTYLFSNDLVDINDIVNDTEVAASGTYAGDNLVADWAGKTGDNSGLPTAYGWDCDKPANWNTPNSGGVRYNDVTSGHTLNSDGSVYKGRLLTLRWDSNDYNTGIYSYPMNVAANTSYQFSFLYEFWSNATTADLTVRISKDKAGNNILASKTFSTSSRNVLYDEFLNFSSEEAGEYYILFTGTWAMFGVGELDVREFNVPSRIIVGKNYTQGAVDMQVSAVKFDDAAYAPVDENYKLDAVIEGETIEMESISNKNITVNGKSELYLTSEAPLTNSTINLTSRDGWLYITNVKPSRVNSAEWFKNITINGSAVRHNSNARVVPYLHGTVIIPFGNQVAKEAVTVYTEENFGGSSRNFAANEYNTDLGAFDNKIRSFKLKKGFSVTFANNSNGTGFSRHYIAEDEDLEISSMPEGLEFASFVRVFYWSWVTKKGWAGGGYLDETNVTWFYDWDAAGNTASMDYEYTPMRHNANWQSYDVINSRENVSCVLGFNEPEREDQANISVRTAINQWPELFKSGLRIGSPAPANSGVVWLKEFMEICDSLNYRVDFSAVHCYEGGNSPSQWANRIQSYFNGYAKQRPVWITEFNNGANWTTEWWPSDVDAQYEKQTTELKAILDALDNSEYVERYAFYNWVEDKRGVVVNNVLTPAGHMFAAHKSSRAYNKNREYVHKWKIAPPWIRSASQSSDYKTYNMSWYDHNGETGLYYVVYRKLSGQSSFTAIDTLYAGKDYSYGGTVNYSTPTPSASAEYKVRARSYKNANSLYSRVSVLTLDAEISAPANLTAEAMGTSIIELSWEAVEGARSYTLKRSTAIDGNYSTVKSGTLDLAHTDRSLRENTTYYYKISSTNNRGESADSEPISITTKTLVSPENITGMTISAGDSKVTISWDFMYDTNFRIFRSDSENGEFLLYASNITTDRYVNTLLTNGQTYYYKVEAYNALGEYAYPEVMKATPMKNHYVYFNFDENSGEKTHDTWGAYHATLYNATWIEDGKRGSAVSFSAADKAYAQIEDGVVSGLSDFSISTWVNYSSVANNSRVFDFGKSTDAFMAFCPNAGGNIRYRITTGSANYVAETEYSFPTNEWVYLTITQSGTTLRVYINGEQVISDTRATVKPSDLGVTTNNYLVRSQWSSDPYSTCKIDEFRIYDRALEAAEVRSLMNETVYSVTMSSRTKSMNAGETFQLFAAVFPDNAANTQVIWTSADPTIAEVDENGVVFAKNEGRTNITATTVMGELTASSRITVSGNITDTSIDEYDAELDVEVFIRGNVLYVNTPAQETVEVYNMAGQMISRKVKQENLDMIELPAVGKQILIIKGEKGWAKKLIQQ